MCRQYDLSRATSGTTSGITSGTTSKTTIFGTGNTIMVHRDHEDSQGWCADNILSRTTSGITWGTTMTSITSIFGKENTIGVHKNCWKRGVHLQMMCRWHVHLETMCRWHADNVQMTCRQCVDYVETIYLKQGHIQNHIKNQYLLDRKHNWGPQGQQGLVGMMCRQYVLSRATSGSTSGTT